MFGYSVALILYIDRRYGQRKWNLMTSSHACCSITSVPSTSVGSYTNTRGVTTWEAAADVNIAGEAVLVGETLCSHEGQCTLPVQVRNPEQGGCWDGDTAWRMPRRQWLHQNWGCCCIGTEAGWYRRSLPGVSEQTLIPHNKGTDSHRTMKNSSIRYTTRRVNFIEDWILEIINHPTVVELCIPVNRFRNLYFSISIFVNKVLFYKKNVVSHSCDIMITVVVHSEIRGLY